MAWRHHLLLASLLILSLATPVLSRSAEASEIICSGRMRFSDCQEAGPYTWPATSQPTFGARCMSCSMLTDAGSTCTPISPGTRDFSVSAPGQPSHGGETYFTMIGTCGDEALYRYLGPLAPGTYEIKVSTNPHSSTIQFTVDDLPPDAGQPGVGQDAGTGTPDAGPRAAPSGCSCVVFPPGDLRSALSGGALLALAARCLPRRRRTP